MPSTHTGISAAIELAPLEMKHAAAMYKWMLDPSVSDNIGLRSVPSLSRTEEWLRRATSGNAFLPLAIYWSGRHVGNVILDLIEPGGASARLSIYIGEADARGHGVGINAIESALRRAFSDSRFELIWLTVHLANTRALRLYRKIGFLITQELAGDGPPSYRMELSRAAWEAKATEGGQR